MLHHWVLIYGIVLLKQQLKHTQDEIPPCVSPSALINWSGMLFLQFWPSVMDCKAIKSQYTLCTTVIISSIFLVFASETMYGMSKTRMQIYGQSCFSIYNHISLASVLTTRLNSFLNTYTEDNWIFPSPPPHISVRALCAVEAWKLSYGCHLLIYCKNALLT